MKGRGTVEVLSLKDMEEGDERLPAELDGHSLPALYQIVAVYACT